MSLNLGASSADTYPTPHNPKEGGPLRSPLLRRLAPLLVPLAALFAPAAAQANHVSECDFAAVSHGSQHVVGVRTKFEFFSDSNKPITSITTTIADQNSVKVGGGVTHGFTFPGSTGYWPSPTGHAWFNVNVSVPAGGSVKLYLSVVAHWPNQGENNGNCSGVVTLQGPPPPPPTCPAGTIPTVGMTPPQGCHVPVPPSTPPTVCPAGTVPTPGMAPPAGCHHSPPPPPRFKTVVKHVVIRVHVRNGDPNVEPPSATAARVLRSTRGYRFDMGCQNAQARSVRCPHGTIHEATWLRLRPRGPHAVRHLRWFVDGNRIHSTQFSFLPTRWGKTATLALFNLPLWTGGRTDLRAWGVLSRPSGHVITVRGTRRERVRLARSARSSWS